MSTLFAACLCACSVEEPVLEDGSMVEITGVEATVRMESSSDTRAAYNPETDPEYVGRPVFVGNDEMIFTKIARTNIPLSDFSYNEISYKKDNTESGGWNRQTTEGQSAKIYWSDAKSEHTFIGYSKPQQPEDYTFLWNRVDIGSGVYWYYGSLGKVSDTGILDYSGDGGKDKLKRDDILLTHSTTMQAEPGGSIAKVHYYHGLANLRIVVNLNGFSTSSNNASADNKVTVTEMIVKDMPMLYKWTQTDAKTKPLNSQDDSERITSVYGEGITIGKTRDIKTWTHNPAGESANQNKKFIFHTLAVPTTEAGQNLRFDFQVSYPDPLNPDDTDKYKTPKYSASVNDVKLYAGKCTTVTINLNHESESMTVGAVYEDWEYVPTPDQSELKKNLTFMTSTERSTVTIIGDEKATVDDATWLYFAGKDANDKDIIKDIYGNDGSEEHPFSISTAAQLLSFAYEVKGTNRRTADQGNGSSITATFDFTGYYVKLDADITMQKSLEGIDVTWPGIGDKDHSFNGVFNGGYRHINKLKGSPFFITIGEDGIVDHLFMSDALGINGRGSIAEVNYGVICGAYIEGDVEAINTGTLAGSYCGSIVGENHSMLISCAHIGDIKGTKYESVGALLGYNDGIVAICYNCGNVTSTESNGEHTYAGIGVYTPRSIAYCSYYNGDLYKGQDHRELDKLIGHVAYPLTTAMMQSNVFVNKEATASPDGMTTTGGEIIDAETQKNDPFFFHLSLNGGIKRSVVMLKQALENLTPDEQVYIPIHGASGSADDPNRYEVLKLKKSLVQWLINHYSTEKTVDGKKELEFSHQFRFIPGTYPKLQ